MLLKRGPLIFAVLSTAFEMTDLTYSAPISFSKLLALSTYFISHSM